jgi:NAD(P)-dependent dehydrogenase (short-subunit alcohol dehydrogenase family)
MSMPLAEGKIVLVTGGGSGIGEASARLFAAEGASAVVIADRDTGGARRVADDIGAEAATVDITDEASVRALIDGIVERHGRLDSALNNAGISGRLTNLVDLSLEAWHEMLAVNLTGAFLCLKHELRVMAAAGRGAIVNTASAAGVVPSPGLAHYCAAKHGVLGLTKTAAKEHVTAGIRVNAVLPGTTRTPMMEAFIGGDADVERIMQRTVGRGAMGTPQEIAEAAVWLCSDRASFVTGESLIVDGGTVFR